MATVYNEDMREYIIGIRRDLNSALSDVDTLIEHGPDFLAARRTAVALQVKNKLGQVILSVANTPSFNDWQGTNQP